MDLTKARHWPRMTVEEFAQITEDGRFDLVGGDVWAFGPNWVSHSMVGTDLLRILFTHVEEHRSGIVLASHVGCQLWPNVATVLCPSIAYISAARVPPRDTDGFFAGAPDIALEVVHFSEQPWQTQMKVGLYLKAGARLVWTIYPLERHVIVYTGDAPPRMLGSTDVLDGGSVLPGFRLPLSEIFEP